jgi:hypothetical protein
MKSLGFNVDRGRLRYVALTGSIAAPVFVNRGHVDHDPAMPSPERMAWFRKTFDSILTEHDVDRVAYRMHWGRGMKQEQVATFHYPWGLLNLLCGERRVEVIETTSLQMTAKRFGLPKGSKPMDVCDDVIGSHPPHWDPAQRYAACAAWMALD